MSAAISLLKRARTAPGFRSWHPVHLVNARESLRFRNYRVNRPSFAFRSTMTYSEGFVPPWEYVPLEDVERLEDYRSGGHHPVMIGDVLHGRYKVVHKLGYGTFSITWLALDEQVGGYVAVKVGTAESNIREVDTVSTLLAAGISFDSSEYPGRGMIPVVLDRFILESPNGKHPSYVTAPARTSVSGAKDGSNCRLFRAGTARSLAAQMVLAVAYMYVRGFVHGDLHLGNFLLRLPPANFDQLSVKALYGKYSEPTLEAVVRIDGKPLPAGVPSHVMMPIWLGQPSDEVAVSDAKLLITDFGESFSPLTGTRYGSRAPMSVAPPEVLFEPERPLSFSSDVWTLACAIWAVVGQKPLFEGFLATRYDIVRGQVDVLGGLPPEWLERWEDSRDAADESRLVHSWNDRFESSIQRPRREEGMEEMGTEEKTALLAMIRSMLAFRPEERPTAQQILESEWMVRWAIPAFEGAQNA